MKLLNPEGRKGKDGIVAKNAKLHSDLHFVAGLKEAPLLAEEILISTSALPFRGSSFHIQDNETGSASSLHSDSGWSSFHIQEVRQ